VRHSICLIAFRQSRILAVDLVSDPPALLSAPGRGAGPGSGGVASLVLGLLRGTVFRAVIFLVLVLVLVLLVLALALALG